MKSFFISVVLLLAISIEVSGETTPKEASQQLSENGISLKDKSIIYTDYQYSLLYSFDFNSYRNYSTKRWVQIEDGPLIELSSIIDMQKLGKTISTEIIENKKAEIRETNLKVIITLVNIGFRYGPKKNTETGF